MFKAIGLALRHTDILIAIYDILKGLGLAIESIKAGGQPNVAILGRKAFAMIPARYKAPVGTATEQEFVDFIYNGVALFTKQKK